MDFAHPLEAGLTLSQLSTTHAAPATAVAAALFLRSRRRALC
jgi:hypothetical protein